MATNKSESAARIHPAMANKEKHISNLEKSVVKARQTPTAGKSTESKNRLKQVGA